MDGGECYNIHMAKSNKDTKQEEVSKEQAKEELEIVKKPEKGFIKVLRANLYLSHMIYIRQLGKYRFEYLVEYGGEVYGAYIIIRPEGKSRRKLTDGEVSQAAALIYNGAISTLNQLLGIELSEEDQKAAEMFEENREKFENQKEKDGEEE